MKREDELSKRLAFYTFLFLFLTEIRPGHFYRDDDIETRYPESCAYLKCARRSQCVRRKFWCKDPPCPNMLYCAKTRKESLKGPSNCDLVRCSKGYLCAVKVRQCHWDEGCKQQLVRCISERDFYEGPASCAGFKCPDGNQCILRESLCTKPPCKLMKSCISESDATRWFKDCQKLRCPSQYECFLRKSSCSKPPCEEVASCTTTTEDEISSEYCRGWVCPPEKICYAEIQGICKPDNCHVKRSCYNPFKNLQNSSLTRLYPYKKNQVEDQSSDERNVATTENRPIFREKEKRNETLAISESLRIRKMSPDFRKINMTLEKSEESNDVWWTKESKIYVPPIYFSTERSIEGSNEPTDFKGTPPPIVPWLDNLRLKTGVDAVRVWTENAKNGTNYSQFQEWLNSVKNVLEAAEYEHWLDKLRQRTLDEQEFQKWIPENPSGNSSRHSNFLLNVQPTVPTTTEKIAKKSDENERDRDAMLLGIFERTWEKILNDYHSGKDSDLLLLILQKYLKEAEGKDEYDDFPDPKVTQDQNYPDTRQDEYNFNYQNYDGGPDRPDYFPNYEKWSTENPRFDFEDTFRIQKIPKAVPNSKYNFEHAHWPQKIGDNEDPTLSHHQHLISMLKKIVEEEKRYHSNQQIGEHWHDQPETIDQSQVKSLGNDKENTTASERVLSIENSMNFPEKIPEAINSRISMAINEMERPAGGSSFDEDYYNEEEDYNKSQKKNNTRQKK